MILEVRFYNGYYGSLNDDGNRKKQAIQDWPPSPSRLFSALTNAFYTLNRLENGKFAKTPLLWFEGLPQPEIYYPISLNNEDNSPVTYVPLNRKESGFVSGIFPKKNGRRFPSVHASSSSIYYVWKDQDPVEGFEEIVLYMDRLGTSRSKATARLIDSIPEDVELVHIVPDDNCKEREIVKNLPTYHPGRLSILDDSYDNCNLQPSAIYVNYKMAENNSVFKINRQSMIVALKGPYRISSSHASWLSDAVRSKLLAVAASLNLSPDALIGKSLTPHMSYLSLPYVGHQYSNGVIMGMNITIPTGDTKEFNECNRILDEFFAQGGKFSYKNDEWELAPFLEDDNTPKTLCLKTWAGPSRVWASVTPSEINWKVNSEQYIFELCKKLGLPVVNKVSIQQHPYFEGVDSDMRKFLSRNVLKNGRQKGFLTHCKIEFSQPVKGPLAIGNTANFGFGLMKPLRSAS
jgi:CRISPR-associated protein Csb2